jgi:hypothetical protein
MSNDSVVIDCQTTFCARIKAARERSGVSLDQIAASTKISASLLRGLEGADLSRWPKGLFRRSYFRDYVRAVGLSPEASMAEFVRLFPDEGPASADGYQGFHSPSSAIEDPDDVESPPLSLALDDDGSAKQARMRARLAAFAIDTTAVFMLSGAAAFLAPVGIWASLAIVAFAYHSVATVALGRSVGSHWMVSRDWRSWKKAAASPAPGSLKDRLRRLHELSVRNRGTVGDAARVPWNAALLRTWFLR